MNDKEQCFALYRSAFGQTDGFDEMLFDGFFGCCRYIKQGDSVAAMMFLLPCVLVVGGKKYDCRYLYAAATDERLRGKGYMTRLIKTYGGGLLLLKPATDALIGFYEKFGFSAFRAVHSSDGDKRVEVGSDFFKLAEGGITDGTEYTAMIKSPEPLVLDGLAFAYTME